MFKLLKSLFFLLIKGALTLENDFCPSCGTNSIRKNGTIHNGKKKNECKKCLAVNISLMAECPVYKEFQDLKSDRNDNLSLLLFSTKSR